MDLVITNLSKTYSNGVRALNDISLTIPRGMFGLLGPNGAGKSSLMRTIATLQEPDAGSIMLGDIDVLKQKDDVRKLLGYLPQEFGLYPNISAENILDHFAVLKGIANNRERAEQVKSLLNRTNLYDVRKKNVGGYSGGMKQRLGIAIALLGNPKLIIVDEPTAGLDPTERNRFLNLLGEIGENIVVILSTHIVEDVRELCSNMAIIAKGNVLLNGTPDSVVSALSGRIWKRRIEKTELSLLMERHAVISSNLSSGKPLVHIYADEQPEEGFIQAEPNLEDVYFHEMYRASKNTIPTEA
jgi:ABC-2 type transport system ATP-binding protein